MYETDGYLESAHRAAEPLLLELEQHGYREEIPIIARSTGRLLSVLVHCMQAHRILELGTAFGYSTLWMAQALPPAGRIWTVDPDTERTTVAVEYFQRAGVRDKVDVMNQSALEVLPLFPQRNLDIIFIDSVKSQYEEYLELCLPLLKLSGLVVIDNLLWGGRVCQKPHKEDDETVRALRKFNKTFLNHPSLDATIVPVGDGTGIGTRIK
ncbi:MAG: O-methyltransferase [Candidatus Eremiobacteraeota bacterium]|nr:O-methyltransferase [Candidatus Eremiobacteraeota bacterium]